MSHRIHSKARKTFKCCISHDYIYSQHSPEKKQKHRTAVRWELTALNWFEKIKKKQPQTIRGEKQSPSFNILIWKTLKLPPKPTVRAVFYKAQHASKRVAVPRDGRQSRRQLAVLPAGGRMRAFPSSFEGPLVEESVTETRAESHA